MSDEQKLAGDFTTLLGDVSDSSGSPDSQAVPGGLRYPPPRRGKAGGQGRAPAPRGEIDAFRRDSSVRCLRRERQQLR